MFTIKNCINNEIIINKSKFICFLIKVYNEDEVKEQISMIKKEYKDATHYCYSYIIDNLKRFNDDGEPSKTAGLPILNVLENNNLNYILCVVVRYFGGIKLGAGGLVRAYTKSVTETLTKANLTELIKGKEITIYFDYNKVKNIDNILRNIKINSKTFSDKTIYKFNLTNDEYEELIENIKSNILDIKIIDNITIEKVIK